MKIEPKLRLRDLIPGLPGGEGEITVSGLSLDSRRTETGDIFFAVRGSGRHGIFHAPEAVRRGAKAVVYDPQGVGPEQLASLQGVPMIGIEKLYARLGEIASRFYGYPSSRLDVIGITGTNGKTSCSQFLAQALDDCGIIGTLGWGEWKKLNDTLNTTPDAFTLQALLAEFAGQGKKVVSMEVSSHGLEQGRVNGIRFKGALFTNITRDHLDYHGSMEAYAEAKLSLLRFPGLEFAAINLDDGYSEKILSAVPPGIGIWGYTCKGAALKEGEVVAADCMTIDADGIRMRVGLHGEKAEVRVPVYGDFNVENVLAVMTVLLAMNMTLKDAAERVASIRPIAGRMEHFRSGSASPDIFVDYAHTPDALENVLSGLRRRCAGQLWVVFGCGGDRDRGKRPQMGAIAGKLADRVVVTDDNPRHEDPDAIVNEILAGIDSGGAEVMRNREQAIHLAVERAGPGDFVLIAGKGHETWQEAKGEKKFFSDVKVVKEALLKKGGRP
ncbi:MAG: UDP-N-acetylmuramoyl-L-alanyl-D-glutamate--2,6-diaminopimelate ligase [Gammaproteobacteria bacterium]